MDPGRRGATRLIRRTLGFTQVSRCPQRMASLPAPIFTRQTSSSTTLRAPTFRHRRCPLRQGGTRPPSGPDPARELTTSDSRRTTPFRRRMGAQDLRDCRCHQRCRILRATRSRFRDHRLRSMTACRRLRCARAAAVVPGRLEEQGGSSKVGECTTSGGTTTADARRPPAPMRVCRRIPAA